MDGLRRDLAVAMHDDAVELLDGDLLLLVFVGQEQGRAAAPRWRGGDDVQRLLLPPRRKEPRRLRFTPSPTDGR